MPAIFAAPAGVGDVAVGLLALPAALYVATGSRIGRWVGIAWNVLGLLDFTIAIAIGITTAPGPLQLIVPELAEHAGRDLSHGHDSGVLRAEFDHPARALDLAARPARPAGTVERARALARRRLVHRRQDRGEPLLHLVAHLRMREHVEFVLADRGRALARRHPPGRARPVEFGVLGGQLARRACGVRRLRRAVALRPIAPASRCGCERSRDRARSRRCPAASAASPAPPTWRPPRTCSPRRG